MTIIASPTMRRLILFGTLSVATLLLLVLVLARFDWNWLRGQLLSRLLDLADLGSRQSGGCEDLLHDQAEAVHAASGSPRRRK